MSSAAVWSGPLSAMTEHRNRATWSYVERGGGAKHGISIGLTLALANPSPSPNPIHFTPHPPCTCSRFLSGMASTHSTHTHTHTHTHTLHPPYRGPHAPQLFLLGWPFHSTPLHSTHTHTHLQSTPCRAQLLTPRTVLDGLSGYMAHALSGGNAAALHAEHSSSPQGLSGMAFIHA